MKDWDHLRVVLALSRAGSLSGAAALLGVNHATISRQIARAEADAGQPLFDRLPSGMVMTPAGRHVAAHAEAIEVEVADLSRALLAQDASMAGELRVTIAPLLANAGFAADIAAFQAAYPAIELYLLGAERVLNLHQREADVAIRVAARPTESLWGRVIAHQRGGWFASASFLATHSAVLESGAGDLPVISFTGWSDPVPDEVLARFSGVRVAARTDDMVTAISLASAGIGMVKVAHVLGAGQGNLQRVSQLALTDYRPVWLLTHPDLRRVPRVATFMTFIADRFAARAALFWGDS
ncbi:MAG: LysR family transcriptional regulator [Deltaproteobacteria bacterium]